MSGYLAACQARVSAARDGREFDAFGFDEIVERTQAAIDGLVLVAVTQAVELTLPELSEHVAFDLPAVAASVARWQRRGGVTVETAPDGATVVRFRAR